MCWHHTHVAHGTPHTLQELRLLGPRDDVCIRLPPTPLHPQALQVAHASEPLAVRLAGGGGSELLTIAPCQVSGQVENLAVAGPSMLQAALHTQLFHLRCTVAEGPCVPSGLSVLPALPQRAMCSSLLTVHSGHAVPCRSVAV